MDGSDKKLLIAMLIIFIILFVVLGLIGMAVRKLMEIQGNRLDHEMGNAARTGVVYDPKTFKALAKEKNRRIYFKQSLVPFLLCLAALLLFIFSNIATGRWGDDLWGQFNSLFYRYDWSNPDNFANFFGITLPCRFPPLCDDAHGGLPYFEPDFWLAYTVIPLWLISVVYYAVVTLAFVSRTMRTNKRASTIYDHHLEDFNYYDTFAMNGNPNRYKKGEDVSSPDEATK